MNTRASVAYGWGLLCLAGGGAYYFAKRSINADREERAANVERRRQDRERLRITETAIRDDKMEQAENVKSAPNAEKLRSDQDPEAHAPRSNVPESRFEAKEPWKSRKGDRFS